MLQAEKCRRVALLWCTGGKCVFVVLPTWLEKKRGRLALQPGITLHYTAHNDTPRRSIIGIMRGYSVLTHSLFMCVHMRACVCACAYSAMTQSFSFCVHSDKARTVIWQCVYYTTENNEMCLKCTKTIIRP